VRFRKFFREVLTFADRGAACREAHTNFADESLCLSADNIRHEVVTLHRSQKVFKMLSFYRQTFLAPAEGVLIYPLKLFCRNICNFPMNIFFNSSLRSVVTVVDLVLQTTSEEKYHKD
jgi:hypothetical protein